MTDTSPPTTLARAAAALALAVSTAIAGGALGLLWVRLFVPRPAMGWDALADTLGGLMLGALLGLTTGAVLAARLPHRHQPKTAATAVALGVLIVLGLAVTAPERPASDPPATRTSEGRRVSVERCSGTTRSPKVVALARAVREVG